LVMTTMLLTTSLPIAAFADDASTTSPLNTAVVAEASENIIYVDATAQGDDGQQNTYKTLQEAISAAKAGDTIQLKSNLTVDESVSNNAAAITIDKNDITIDGQNHTLTVDSNNANGNAIGINGASGVTIQNLTVERPGDGHTKHGINVYKSTGVTLHNVNLTNMGGFGLLVNASEVTVTGTFSLSGNGWKDIINVGWGDGISGVSHKSSFDASNATLKGVDKIYVDKGDLDRAGNADKFAINANGFMKVSAESLDNGIAYAPVAATVNGTNYATLQAAINAADANTVVELSNDITLQDSIEITKAVNIDGNNYSITADQCAAFYIQSDLSNLNIHDVTITGTGAGENVSESMSGEPFMGLGTYNGCYGVADLQLSNVTIEGFTYGLYFGKNPSGTTGTFNENPVKITAKNLIVKNNYVKGLYVEKLTDSSFDGCQFIDNGKDTSKVAAGLQAWMSGVDINLKNGSYQNINFTNCTFTGNGQNNGTALHIKARSDGNYGADTRLSGVTVSGCTFTDNNAASGPIVLGEPGKGNLSPVNVNLQNNVTVTNNVADTISIAYDANEGQSAIETTIIAKDGSITNLPVPTRDGYTFDGWFTEATGGDKVTTETVFDKDTTLYAQWSENADEDDNNSGGGTPTPDPDKPGDGDDNTDGDDNNDSNDNIGDTVTNPDGSTTTTVTTDDGSSSTTTVGT
ncbi:MAG: InlB B-repeat-containing protein, partial [Peptococcaceae bacterium]|nr:InlB B-repeat-containing protein [Peptococcaceae bacterium]